LSLIEQLSAYLTRVSGGRATVVRISRISGGASRETYRFDAEIDGVEKGYILRRDPPGSLIETDRRLEFLAIRSFTDKGVAAPEALWLEEDGAELERPFFIMARIDGGVTGGAFGVDPYGEHAAAIGEQFFTYLGRIAGEDVEKLPIMDAATRPAPEDCWRQQLDYWAGVIDEDELHPQPIVRAAIRKLRASPPPPPAKIAVVHGDYRTGNFLHDNAGKIVAVLDWEMAHLGDPLEDIGWATDPLWSNPTDHRVSGMVPKAEALALWEQASGLKVDPRSLAWWSMFASVKAQAIWTSSAKEWRDGGYREPILAFSGWFTARRQDEILSRRLAEWEAA
jgi:aminoglycoside phosphotransferase (APT) family kinase protein